MHLLDLDYVELENRRAAQLAALQWHTVTRISGKEFRYAHRKFVFKVYLLSLLCIFLVVTQWWILTKLKAVQKFIIIHYYVIIGIVFIHFLILTLMQYVLKHETKRRHAIVVSYIIIMMEFGSITISRPILAADFWTFINASIFTFIMWSIGFGMALISHTDSDRSPAYLSLWSQKYYLTTAIFLLMTMQFRFILVQISITLVMVFFISIFFVVWGRVLGSLKFYRGESKYCNYYIVLNFMNLISLFANTLIFIERIYDMP